MRNRRCADGRVPSLRKLKVENEKLRVLNRLNRISQMNIKRCDQQFLQISIIVFEKEFNCLAIVFFCVKLPVGIVLYTLYNLGLLSWRRTELDSVYGIKSFEIREGYAAFAFPLICGHFLNLCLELFDSFGLYLKELHLNKVFFHYASPKSIFAFLQIPKCRDTCKPESV